MYVFVRIFGWTSHRITKYFTHVYKSEVYALKYNMFNMLNVQTTFHSVKVSR